jgi:hypothetical protein
VGETLLVDLDAPILPGRGAAGLTLGQSVPATPEGFTVEVEQYYQADGGKLVPGPTGRVWYRSAAVDLAVVDGILTEIVLHGSYRGKWLDRVGVGDTVSDFEAASEHDSEQAAGLSFEVPPSSERASLQDQFFPLVRLIVYRPSSEPSKYMPRSAPPKRDMPVGRRLYLWARKQQQQDGSGET